MDIGSDIGRAASDTDIDLDLDFPPDPAIDDDLMQDDPNENAPTVQSNDFNMADEEAYGTVDEATADDGAMQDDVTVQGDEDILDISYNQIEQTEILVTEPSDVAVNQQEEYREPILEVESAQIDEVTNPGSQDASRQIPQEPTLEHYEEQSHQDFEETFAETIKNPDHDGGFANQEQVHEQGTAEQVIAGNSPVHQVQPEEPVTQDDETQYTHGDIVEERNVEEGEGDGGSGEAQDYGEQHETALYDNEEDISAGSQDDGTQGGPAFEYSGPQHDIMVNFLGSVVHLFPVQGGEPDTMYLIRDRQFLYKTIRELLQQCRKIGGDFLVEEDELELEVRGLGLIIGEVGQLRLLSTWLQLTCFRTVLMPELPLLTR